VPGVDPRVVGEPPEDLAFEAVEQLGEPLLVAPRVPRAPGEQRVAGEQVGPLVAVHEVEQGPVGVARRVQHLDLEVADLSTSLVTELAVERRGEQLVVARVAPDRQPRIRRRQLSHARTWSQCPWVCTTAIGSKPSIDLTQPLRTGGRVDQQRGPRPRAGEHVDVVVHLLDGHLADQERAVGAFGELAVGLDVAGVLGGRQGLLGVGASGAADGCGGDLVAARSTGRERGGVAEGGLGDVAQRLLGEEGLVGGDQHVGERQQPREDVVLDDPVGEVLEEQVALLLVDVEREVADPTVLERLDDGRVSISAPGWC
jgi:hypothetical protein